MAESMHAPYVTVLMPAYNASRHIAEAIDSLLGQTYGNFELLVVDDGSTDCTREIVKSYGDDRVRLVCRGSNSGVAATLNFGLQIAATDLIARLDADDIAYPRRLELQVAYMDSHPDCSLLGSWFDCVDDRGRLQDTVHGHCETAVLRWCLLTRNVIAHPSVMLRRIDALAAGGYDTQSHNSEDHALWAAMAPRTMVAQIPRPLIAYRDNPEGVSRMATRESDSIVVAQRALSEAIGRAVPLDVVRCLRGIPPVHMDRELACCQALSVSAAALCGMIAGDETARGLELQLLHLWQRQAERLCDISPGIAPDVVATSTRLAWRTRGVRGFDAGFAESTLRSIALAGRAVLRRLRSTQPHRRGPG